MNKFKVVCATQLGGRFGLQLWGVAEDGPLFSTLQTRPNGPWEEWSEWKTAPPNIIALTAARNGKGEVSLWALDSGNVLHCRSQISVDNDDWEKNWGPWSDPKAGWWQPPRSKLTRICACEPAGGGLSGRQFWGVGKDGLLYSTYEASRQGGDWVSWFPWWDRQPEHIIALTAEKNGNGEVSLWALDSDRVLHCRSQKQNRAGEEWDPWSSGRWWSVPPSPFTQICACMQGGSLGRAIWGIGADRQLYWTYEQAAQGGGWVQGWPRFGAAGEPRDIRSLCAARQNDGRVVLWALTTDNSLHNTIQTAAGAAAWAKWDVGGTPWFGFIDETVRTLSRKPGNEGVTYLRTSGNKFTLLDTPRLWGQGPVAPEKRSEACKTFLDQITEVIASAERTLDITLLFNVDPSVSGFPDGGFRDAIAKGFKALSDKSRPPEIWILFGAPLDPNAYRKVSSRMPLLLPVAGAGAGLQKWLDTTYPKKMKAWLQATIKLYQDDLKAMKCPVHVALNNPSTWNHAKIIAADDRRVITGGHNFWAGDYLGSAPVHDVSGRFDGPAARGAHRFCDKLWQGATHTIHLINGNWTQSDPARVVIDDDPVPPAGKVDMLSLGRLGRGLGDFSISSNASVTARIVALCKAKRIIRISQQSLLGFGSTPYDFYTCLAIVRAVRAGVDVQIVLSNELNNYGGSAPGVLRQLQNMYLADIQQTPPDDRYKQAPPRDNIDAWADLASGQKPLVSVMKGRSSWDPRLKDFNDKLTLATLYYSDDKRWKVGGRWFDAGNHCKVYIIDEDCFYVGSDNFYPSLHKEGLQEFGFLVEDKNETQNFIATYWDNLWKYSEKGRLS